MQPADWQWLRQLKDVVNNREEHLPEVGRYNAGQKLLFFLIGACLVGLLLSGLVIWRAYFSLYFPIGVIRLASLVHAVCSFGLICAILLHIYAAFWVKGSLHAMLRGTVTSGWAWKHHRAWFRQVTHAAHPRTRPD
jgi:formate dehydrogenase subunit gamma